MRLDPNDSFHGINCDYARRREFHRPFWDALRAQLRHWMSGSGRVRKSGTASF